MHSTLKAADFQGRDMLSILYPRRVKQMRVQRATPRAVSILAILYTAKSGRINDIFLWLVSILLVFKISWRSIKTQF